MLGCQRICGFREPRKEAIRSRVFFSSSDQGRTPAGWLNAKKTARSRVALLEEVHSKIPAVATQENVEELAQRVEHKVCVRCRLACRWGTRKARAEGLPRRPRWLRRATRHRQ